MKRLSLLVLILLAGPALAAPEIKRARVDKLREGDPKNKDSVKELATTEGEFRQQMIDEGFANSTSINRLADRFSDETLEKLEEKKTT